MLIPSQREVGKLLTSTGVFGKAAFYLEKQFHKDPSDVANSARYLESLFYYDKDEQFIKVGNELVKNFGDNVTIHGIMAEFYEYKMDFDKARYHWMEILKINGTLEVIREKFINYCISNKDYDSLIAFYEYRIKKQSASLDDYYTLANIYSLRKDIDNAKRVYEELVSLYPYEEIAKKDLAYICSLKGLGDKAIALYKSIWEARKDNIMYAIDYAQSLVKFKRTDEAVATLKEFREVYRGNKLFGSVLTGLYVELGMFSEAIDLLKKRYAENPSDYKLLREMAQLYFDSKDTRKAFETINLYHEKTGGSYGSHHMLGDLLDSLGDKDGSRREYEKALELIRK